MAMLDIKETKAKSKHMQLNGRDFLRGLAIVIAVAVLTILQEVSDVRELASPELWWSVLNATWKPFVAYLLLNIRK